MPLSASAVLPSAFSPPGDLPSQVRQGAFCMLDASNDGVATLDSASPRQAGISAPGANRKSAGSAQWAGFFAWALATASLAAWTGEILAGVSPVPPVATMPATAVAGTTRMVRLFGEPAPLQRPASLKRESDRFRLLGVIDPGFALVSVDGGPARAWRIGSTIDGNTTLLTVIRRAADFGPRGGPATFSLQLPEPGLAESHVAHPWGPTTAPARTAVDSPDGETPPRKHERRQRRPPRHAPHRGDQHEEASPEYAGAATTGDDSGE